jgi:hypothetical protein
MIHFSKRDRNYEIDVSFLRGLSPLGRCHRCPSRGRRRRPLRTGLVCLLHRRAAGHAELGCFQLLHILQWDGIYAPTGEFQKDRLANQGLGYWTFEPGVLISYLGQKNGFEFSTYIGYDINTENTETDYHSGQQFHVDATVAQHLPLGPGFIGIGANAFYLQQTTGDSSSGARLGSFEEMTAGIGPVLSYAGQIGKTSFAAEQKWLPQIDAQETLKGDYIWFKVGVQF